MVPAATKAPVDDLEQLWDEPPPVCTIKRVPDGKLAHWKGYLPCGCELSPGFFACHECKKRHDGYVLEGVDCILCGAPVPKIRWVPL